MNASSARGGEVSRRFGQATNRLYPHLVRRAGNTVGRAPATGGLDLMAGHQYATVVSYRRSGEPVATPVWFGIGDGRLYFRSLADTAKLRRIAANPAVLVAPCSLRGRPLGPPFAGRARILGPDEEAEAERHIQANYGAGRRVYKRAIRGAPARYVEVTPVDDRPSGG